MTMRQWQHMLSDESSPPNFEQIAQSLETQQREQQELLLEEGSAVLAGIFCQLARMKHGFLEDADNSSHPSSSSQAVKTARKIVRLLDLEDTVELIDNQARAEAVTQYQAPIVEMGVRIRQLRKEHGLSQTQLANLTGVSRFTILHLEKGRKDDPELTSSILALLNDAQPHEKA